MAGVAAQQRLARLMVRAHFGPEAEAVAAALFAGRLPLDLLHKAAPLPTVQRTRAALLVLLRHGLVRPWQGKEPSGRWSRLQYELDLRAVLLRNSIPFFLELVARRFSGSQCDVVNNKERAAGAWWRWGEEDQRRKEIRRGIDL